MNNKFKDTLLGGILSNPVFVLVLGMCPVIATSSTVSSAFSMGVATCFVLICSNLFISMLRKVIPDQVRLPAYIIIIATFVTIVQMFVESFLPSLNDSIGSFISLIVVNCIILGRAESFASKNTVPYALLDGVSMGVGFIIAMVMLGAVREFLTFIGLSIFATTAGGFIVLGFMMAAFNVVLGIYKSRQKEKEIKGAM